MRKQDKQTVQVMPYDGKTVRQQRRYIRFLENLFVAALILLVISGTAAIAMAMRLYGM